MGLYTPSQRTRDVGTYIWPRITLLIQYRLNALGAALTMGVFFGLYQALFERGLDLVPRAIAGFFVGELLALITAVPMGIRNMPLTTLLHIGITCASLYALFHFVVPVLPIN